MAGGGGGVAGGGETEGGDARLAAALAAARLAAARVAAALAATTWAVAAWAVTEWAAASLCRFVVVGVSARPRRKIHNMTCGGSGGSGELTHAGVSCLRSRKAPCKRQSWATMDSVGSQTVMTEVGEPCGGKGLLGAICDDSAATSSTTASAWGTGLASTMPAVVWPTTASRIFPTCTRHSGARVGCAGQGSRTVGAAAGERPTASACGPTL